MTAVPFTHCCQLLAVDAKTLRQWLKQANLSLQAHPTDARVKCLTLEHLHLLARLHERTLQAPLEGRDPSDASQQPSQTESRVLTTSAHEVALAEKLAQLEAQVASLQGQITLLALQLLQERQQRTEQRLQTLEALLPSTDEQALAPLAGSAPTVPCPQERLALACHPTEQRTQLIPLIAYAAGGSYVLICPKQGELPILANSAEWFAWLASLSSFRFVGQSGRFSARRGYNRRPNRGWYAQRTIHQQSHSKYIGVSEHVTTDRLEHIALQFQSYLN